MSEFDTGHISTGHERVRTMLETGWLGLNMLRAGLQNVGPCMALVHTLLCRLFGYIPCETVGIKIVFV
jgi:hypothetical protein